MLLTSSLLAVFVFSFTISIAAVISPGPVSTAIVSQAPRRGWLVGPMVAAGHSFSEFVIIAFIALGLSSFLVKQGVQELVALAGALVLFLMGAVLIWNTWRGKLRLPSSESLTSTMSSKQLIGMGAIATISNPFWYAWWVTAVPGYLTQVRSLGLAAIAVFFVGHIAADFIWDSFLSTIIGGGRSWLTDRMYRGLLLACGAYFIYLAGSFFVVGLQGLSQIS